MPKEEREYKLIDTGVLDEDRFFDITVVHAKDTPDDIVIEFRVVNHGPEAAPLDVLGQWWFRNTWAWQRDDRKPTIARGTLAGRDCLTATHDWLGTHHLVAEDGPNGPARFLLCDNETNAQRIFGPGSGMEQPAHPKDAIDDAVVHGDESRLADAVGTKAADWWHLDAVQPGEEVVLRLRMMGDAPASRARRPFAAASEIVADRKADADAFYAVVIPEKTCDEDRFIARRAFAGLMWCKRGWTVDLPDHGELPIDYQPAESRDYLFGGNSNWRGPVWFPVNNLLLHSLATYGRGVAADVTFEYPTGSGNHLSLEDITHDLRQRMISLVRVGPDGRRPSDPVHKPTGPLWQAHPTFSEYFNGDNGAGLGAAHQTGWTAMVADLICLEDGDDPILRDATS